MGQTTRTVAYRYERNSGQAAKQEHHEAKHARGSRFARHTIQVKGKSGLIDKIKDSKNALLGDISINS